MKTKLTKLFKRKRACPKCKSSWDGGSILETFIQQRDQGYSYWKDMSDEQIEVYVIQNYSKPYRWGREVGIELAYDHPKHYDGISYWQCPDCKTTFNRFTGIEEVIS